VGNHKNSRLESLESYVKVSLKSSSKTFEIESGLTTSEFHEQAVAMIYARPDERQQKSHARVETYGGGELNGADAQRGGWLLTS
jgi:hypothetical protein